MYQIANRYQNRKIIFNGKFETNSVLTVGRKNDTVSKIARLAQTFGAGILPWENRVFAQFARSIVAQLSRQKSEFFIMNCYS